MLLGDRIKNALNDNTTDPEQPSGDPSASEFPGRDDERLSHAEYAARTGYETRQLRRVLEEYAPENTEVSAELGAAYGRLTTTIAPFGRQHIAIEPRDGPRAEIRPLYPEVDACAGIASEMPIETDGVGLLVTWAVLQHVEPESFQDAVSEIGRVVSENGVCVCCEETHPDAGDNNGTFRRSVEEYQENMAGFELVHTEPRKLEPPNRETAGTVMVFSRSDVPSDYSRD